jgi:tetratricopeptide (TPR) repeat protein
MRGRSAASSHASGTRGTICTFGAIRATRSGRACACAAALVALVALVAPLALTMPTARADSPSGQPAFDPSLYLRAYSAAMQGRKAETLAAVAGMVQSAPIGSERARDRSGWDLSAQYAALVRFGLWDEMLAVLPPDARDSGLTAGYLYARGVALAARGRLDEARKSVVALRTLGAQLPMDASLLRGVLDVAEPIVAARIAASAGRNDEAVALLGRAVEAEDRLPDGAHADWFFPTRQLLGAQLLIAARPREAEAVYREDLSQHPANGWSLYGLAAALSAEGRSRRAARVRAQFQIAWQHADVRLPASAFWIAGPDTRSCECQRQPSAASAERQTGGELLGAQHEAGIH